MARDLTDSKRSAKLAISALVQFVETGEPLALEEAYTFVQLAAPGVERPNATGERPAGVPKCAKLWGGNLSRSVVWWRSKSGAFIQYANKTGTRTELGKDTESAARMFGFFNVQQALRELKRD